MHFPDLLCSLLSSSYIFGICHWSLSFNFPESRLSLLPLNFFNCSPFDRFAFLCILLGQSSHVISDKKKKAFLGRLFWNCSEWVERRNWVCEPQSHCSARKKGMTRPCWGWGWLEWKGREFMKGLWVHMQLLALASYVALGRSLKIFEP